MDIRALAYVRIEATDPERSEVDDVASRHEQEPDGREHRRDQDGSLPDQNLEDLRELPTDDAAFPSEPDDNGKEDAGREQRESGQLHTLSVAP